MKTQIIVNKVPIRPIECPFALMDCDFGYAWICNIDNTICNLALKTPKPCEQLIAPFTFEESEE